MRCPRCGQNDCCGGAYEEECAELVVREQQIAKECAHQTDMACQADVACVGLQAEVSRLADALDGEVQWNTSLKAEVDRLTSDLQVMTNQRDSWQHRTMFEQKFTEEMRGEVARMTAELSVLHDAMRDRSCIVCEKHRVLYQPRNGCADCRVDAMRGEVARLTAELAEESKNVEQVMADYQDISKTYFEDMDLIADALGAEWHKNTEGTPVVEAEPIIAAIGALQASRGAEGAQATDA